jgi:hypothetical protein
MISGAVFANELSGQVDCDLVLSGQYDLLASAENVSLAQASETGFQYSFTAQSEENKKVKVSGSVSFDPDTGAANGKLVHSLDKSGQEIPLTGDVSASEDEGAVDAFSLASADGSVQIDCESSAESDLESVFDGVN